MESIAGLLAELLLIFEDFKFWLKRRRQRKYERKHGLSKTSVLYPSQKIMMVGLLVVLLIVLTFSLLRFTVYLWGNKETQTIKRLTEVASLLKHQKETSGHYPKELSAIIRNNPLLKNIHKDYWGQEFFYERHPSGESFVLISLGSDGLLNTSDDIAYKFEID
ncbi:type II secretion system protein GspG [Gelidibacter japonicus]|jgi:hypothetical protein|uniref:type II secretion system protein GspG n=1 Tax=Gelidibacter japonicus TaxID=1962232 RepID=UPI0013D44C84|nr:type II secretion system protein GspG [Gelidibacter japonicus]